jgi:murein DD-endopeptidase MepM/ murein hydrolase activator NlpD
MSSVVELLRSHSRAIALAAIAVSAAGCSADSNRFTDGPFASRGTPGEVTGSVGSPQAAPIGRVETTRLPPPTDPSGTYSADTGVAGGGRGLASFHPAQGQAPAPEITGTVPAPVVRKPPPPAAPQWTWDGGTAVTVAQGETIDTIARRHGVPSAAIMQANSLTGPAVIYPGQRLVIPRVQHALAPPASAPAPRPPSIAAAKAAPAPAGGVTGTPPGQAGVHVVASGDTLSKISRLYRKSVDEIARANNIQPQGKLNIGDRIVIPGARVTNAQAGEPAKEAAPATPIAKPANAPAAKTNPASKQTATPATETAAMVTPAADTPSPTGSTKGTAQAAAPTFRWPVHGKVIAGFGPRPNGQQNDGINVAVPENTPVKAAEDGVVAYAGSELKGYGNLVLVRHSNGYVTAYAHAKEIMVKRGDQIKRGQVIAKSGQTGAVDAPQLHFEVRKGPTPQDPMPMLSGG